MGAQRMRHHEKLGHFRQSIGIPIALCLQSYLGNHFGARGLMSPFWNLQMQGYNITSNGIFLSFDPIPPSILMHQIQFTFSKFVVNCKFLMVANFFLSGFWMFKIPTSENICCKHELWSKTWMSILWCASQHSQ